MSGSGDRQVTGTALGPHGSRPSKNRDTPACECARTDVPPQRWTAAIRLADLVVELGADVGDDRIAAGRQGVQQRA
ncbi:hypothetical protein, partial [Streptomyces broussonetiae]|uniref:hypothetical protein n=1 Tax=Streptomyces broussonetiae TaxID=2686304 RepID=UPI0035D5ADAA